MAAADRLDVVALTQQLVRADSVNPPGNEDRCIAPLADLLNDAGFRCRVVAFAPARPTLIARLPGAQAARTPLCLTGHVDVVPLGATAWRHDPFGGEIVDGRLYGRGASDMKGGIAAIVAAAIARADVAREGAGVTLILTAGEESGCEGAFHLSRHPDARSWLGAAGALVVAEPTSNLPRAAHTGALWLTAEARGVCAHGSMPQLGDNAIYKIAHAALALQAFRIDEPAHPLMGRSTLNVGTVRGGANLNSVPDAAELTIDIRSVAGTDHAALRHGLCRAVGDAVQLSTLLDLDSVYTDVEVPWMRRAAAIVAGTTGVRSASAAASYFTDAAALRPVLGMPPTLIVGPGEPTQAHQTDEYCEVDKLLAARTFYAGLIDDWCTEPA
jgi:succinyl-diaminopimelate desuccinylase